MTFLIIVTSLNARPSILLEQDQKAPFKGLLFTENESKEIKVQLIQLDALKEMNKSLERSLELQKLEIELTRNSLNLYKEQNNDLTEVIKSNNKSLTSWEKVFYFSLGIITTTAIVYATSHALK